MPVRAAIAAAVAAGIMTVCTATLSAATLRSATVITSDVVKLSDLFADLEPRQDKIIGPAPKPGASIYVGGRQLIAIADQYGVDWLDESPSAMATITRSGRVLDKEFFVGLVQKSLPDIGTGPVSIDLADFHPITVASDDPKPVVLSDVDWDQRTGRFSATVYRTHPTGDITQDSFLLTGIVRAPRRVLVFSRSLPAGAVISASDVNIDESYTGYATAKIFTDETEVDGMTLLHTVVAGEPVLERDLHRTVLMHKGDPVLIVFTAPGVHLTATGRALEDGGNGQYVHALNLASSMIVTGRVAGASQVDVDAGSGAVPSDPNMLRRLTASARANTRSDLSIR